ncbi:MAG: substrate-binding domain-containing protein [Lachnotalea sp.]
MKKKLLSVTMGIVLTAAMLAGCTSSSDDKSTSDASSSSVSTTETTTDTTTDTTKKAASDITIGSVIMNTSGEWFAEVMKGQQDAADELGIKISMVSANNDISTEYDYANQFVSQGVDALVICPISSDSSVAAIDLANEASIPVVNWNCTVNTDTNSFIGVDANELGGNTGTYLHDYIEANYPDGCKVALITNSSYEIGIARCEGFKAAIQDLIDSGKIEIVNEQEAEAQDDGMTVTEQMLAADPEINVIWAWNQTSLLGAAAELQNEQNKTVVLSGTDMSVELAKDMQNDDITLQVITTQQPYVLGYQAVKNAYNIIQGETVEKTVMVPVTTYSKDDMDGISEYITSHESLVN